MIIFQYDCLKDIYNKYKSSIFSSKTFDFINNKLYDGFGVNSYTETQLWRQNMLKKLALLVALMVVLAISSVDAQVDVLKHIPQDSDFVFSINIKQLISNPNVKKSLEENLKSNPQQKKTFDEFVANTGIDLFKDLHSALVFTSGKTAESTGKQMAGAIVSGNFNPEKILSAIKKDPNAAKDVEIGKLGKFDAVIPKNPDDGYGVFLDKNTLAIGSKISITSVLEIAEKKAKNVSSRKDFASILKNLNYNATLSGAGLMPAELKEKMKKNPQAAALAAIDYFFFDFTNADNIVLNFNGEVDKKENLDSVSTALNGFLAMAKMFTAQAPEAAEILNTIKVTSSGKSVQIAMNVPKEKLEEIKKRVEERVKQMKEQGAPEREFDRE